MTEKDNVDELLEKKTQDYGDGVEAMQYCGQFWTLFLQRKGILKNGERIKGQDVCSMMILFKQSREGKKHKEDMENWTDSTGYARLGMKCIKAETEEGKK